MPRHVPSADACAYGVGIDRALDLIGRNALVLGWASGTAIDSTDAMAFAASHGIRPRIERFRLAAADAAVARMMSGKARFRDVLEMGG